MCAIFLISRYSLLVLPSTKYVAKVYGQPTKPRTAVSGPTSWRKAFNASATNGVLWYGSILWSYFSKRNGEMSVSIVLNEGMSVSIVLNKGMSASIVL